MLRLLSPPATSRPPSPTATQEALRQVLPKQQPLQPLITQLARIAVQVEPPKQLMQSEPTQGAATATRPEQPASRTTSNSATPTANATPQRLSAQAYNAAASTTLLRSDKSLLDSSSVLKLPQLPPKVEQAITSLIKQLPSNDKLTQPEGLKQAVNNSGIFFEGKLLTSSGSGTDKAALSGDLKTILFRVASLIRNTLQSLPPLPSSPPAAPHAKGTVPQAPQGRQAAAQTQAVARQLEAQSLLQLLGKQSESALARIQTNQLNSLQAQQQGGDTVLNLEIPLFNGRNSEVLELKIRRESRRQREEAEAIWSVTLKLDNEDHGTIRAVVTLIGKKVSTTFWCEQSETQQLFAQRMEELRQRINEQGLELGRTQAFTGVPPEPDGPSGPNNNDGIFRTQA